MEWSNDVVLEFLDLYKQEPMIWCPNHKDYRNRRSVTNGWRRIAKNISINCSVNELKKKKDSLMATFRPLVNKVNTMSIVDSGGEVFKPSWFAYEKMESFLLAVYKPRVMQNTEALEDSMNFSEESMQDMKNITFSDTEKHDTDSLDEYDMTNNVKEEPNYDGTKEPIIEENTRKRCAEHTQKKTDEPTKMAKTSLNNEAALRSQCTLYGQLVAHKLETLDEVTRAIVMHEIDNILFRAVMNRLQPEFIQENSSNPNRCPPENCGSLDIHHQIPTLQSNMSTTQSPILSPSRSSSTHTHSL